jgi:hypothetical protein
MIIDGNLLLDTAAAITSSGVSTNVIDLGVARDMGIGDADQITPKVMCLVNTAFTTTNSATLTVNFQGSTDNTTWDTYLSSPAYAAAALGQGARLLDVDVPRPAAGKALPRYLRLSYTVGTGVFSAGAVTAAIVLGRADQIVSSAGYQSGYPSGFSVNN